MEVEPGSQNTNGDVESLARSLASTAHAAEVAAVPADPAQVQRHVASSVEALIITAGKPPTNVRVALQRAVYVCMRPDEIKHNNFNCPATEAGIQGLHDVLATVTALIDGSQPAALDGPGKPPVSSPPALVAGGGADYQQVP